MYENNGDAYNMYKKFLEVEKVFPGRAKPFP